jgi:hypothetical protein
MKTAAIGITVLILVLMGCDWMEPKYEWVTDQQLRQELFFKCLDKIPQGPTTTKYNDWDDVIEECDSAAYRMAQKKVPREQGGLTVPIGRGKQ